MAGGCVTPTVSDKISPDLVEGDRITRAVTRLGRPPQLAGGDRRRDGLGIEELETVVCVPGTPTPTSASEVDVGQQGSQLAKCGIETLTESLHGVVEPSDRNMCERSHADPGRKNRPHLRDTPIAQRGGQRVG